MVAEPLFAALFAYLLQGSVLSPVGLAGAGIITLAVIVAEVLPSAARRPRQAAGPRDAL